MKKINVLIALCFVLLASCSLYQEQAPVYDKYNRANNTTQQLIDKSLAAPQELHKDSKYHINEDEINDIDIIEDNVTNNLSQEITSSPIKPIEDIDNATENTVQDVDLNSQDNIKAQQSDDAIEQMIKRKKDLINQQIKNKDVITPVISTDNISIKDITKTSKTNIAFLLPLSGKFSKVGRSLADAAKMALHDLNKKHNLNVRYYDTKGNAQQSISAVKRAISGKADIILGPLLSTNSHAIKPIIAANNIKVISFTNDSSAAGNNILVFGISPEQQIDKIISYANHSLVISDFSALIPANKFGKAIEKKLKQYAGDNNINVQNIITYSADDQEINKATLQLLEIIKDDRNHGIIIPEGKTIPAKIAKIIAQNSPNNTAENSEYTLLGGMSWNIDSVKNDRNLNGSFFANQSKAQQKLFSDLFYKKYKYKSPTVASLAYDAINLVALLEPMGDINRQLNNSTNRYDGVNGNFTFTPRGIAKRNFEIIKIDNNKFLKM